MPLFLPHFNLQSVNTLAVPATAHTYVCVNTKEELLEALIFSKENALPVLILGGGSNIVLREDFPGIVIHLKSKGIDLVQESSTHYWVRAQAGEIWAEFVDYCLDQAYWGLENLSLIPGCVGAAPIQNIGAYGVELADVFSELTALDIQSGLEVTFPLESCRFGYRNSVFKGELKDRFVILSVTFKLSKQPNLVAVYPALQEFIYSEAIQHPGPKDIAEAVCHLRRSKLPDPKDLPNVGSFFHNPVISIEQFLTLEAAYPQVVAYPQGDSVKLAAGWLIDKAGWRGFIGDAGVHAKQALVLTNPKRLMGSSVLDLAEQVKADVFEKFGVNLTIEPRIYPDFS